MELSSEFVNLRVLKVTQPIGTFFVGKMKASDLVSVSFADIRHVVSREELTGQESRLDTYIGIQRNLKSKRVQEIREYVQTVDACFPNSIILSINSDAVMIDGEQIQVKRKPEVATIIDGQHRLAGFTSGLVPDFELIVTIFLDMDLEEQAYLFSTINTKQVPINHSLARDLLEFSRVDTPEKMVHNLAKAANGDPNNPWYRQIKMLGLKDAVSNGTITQHAYVTQILNLIYPEEDYQYDVRSKLMKNGNKRDELKSFPVDSVRYPLWTYYLTNNDAVIKRILDNYFNAVRKVFPVEWGNPSFILSKTTGYRALMLQFREFIKEGLAEKSLKEDFFLPKLQEAKERLGDRQLIVTEFFVGESSARELQRVLFGTRE